MTTSPLIYALELLTLILILVKLRSFVSLTPSLIACMARWKESVNLEESMELARERNAEYFILLIPDIILFAHYNLFHFGFMEGMCAELRIAVTAGVFAAYAVMRLVMATILGKGNCNNRLYQAYLHSFRNFAIIASMVALCCAFICSLIGTTTEDIARIVRILVSLCYAVYLIHKSQIFASVNTGFTSFLYLCGLEILPSAILLAAAIVL